MYILTTVSKNSVTFFYFGKTWVFRKMSISYNGLDN